MRNRIKKIIEYENISYSKFADIVGIERSGVSHLINGRNNPSLDVIQKILETFEYINTDWLLLNKGPMIKEDKIETQEKLFSEIPDNKTEEQINETKRTDNSISETNLINDTKKKNIFDSREDKKIVKIVIFYSDKTFSEFIPE